MAQELNLLRALAPASGFRPGTLPLGQPSSRGESGIRTHGRRCASRLAGGSRATTPGHLTMSTLPRIRTANARGLSPAALPIGLEGHQRGALCHRATGRHLAPRRNSNPRLFPLSGYRGSNPGPSPRQGDALPLSYIRVEPARRIELRLHPYQRCVLPLSLGRHRSGSWTRTSVHAGQSRVGMPANPPRIVEPSPGADPGVPAVQRATRAPARKAIPPVKDSTPSFRARIRTLTYVTQNHASCQLDHPESVIR
jgi:hypothetical protein